MWRALASTGNKALRLTISIDLQALYRWWRSGRFELVLAHIANVAFGFFIGKTRPALDVRGMWPLSKHVFFVLFRTILLCIWRAVAILLAFLVGSQPNVYWAFLAPFIWVLIYDVYSAIIGCLLDPSMGWQVRDYAFMAIIAEAVCKLVVLLFAADRAIEVFGVGHYLAPLDWLNVELELIWSEHSALVSLCLLLVAALVCWMIAVNAKDREIVSPFLRVLIRGETDGN